MEMQRRRHGRYLRRGQRIVVGFYLTMILSAVAWISAWGLKGTTLVERVFGRLPEFVLTSLFFVPGIACVVFLLLLQGSAGNRSLAVREPDARTPDERQLQGRNAPYQRGYKPVYSIFLFIVGYVAVVGIYHLPLPYLFEEGFWIFVLIFLLIVSMPMVISAWRRDI